MKKFYVDIDLNTNDLTNGVILNTNTLNSVIMDMDSGADEAYDVYYRNASGNLERLAPNITTTEMALTMTGTGALGQAPVWAAVTSNIQKFSRDITALTTETITAATHGCGAEKSLFVVVYEDGTPNVEVAVDIEVADNGDVTRTSTAALTGHIVIMG